MQAIEDLLSGGKDPYLSARVTVLSEISLEEALKLDVIAAYRKRETGQKYLLNPNKLN